MTLKVMRILILISLPFFTITGILWQMYVFNISSLLWYLMNLLLGMLVVMLLLAIKDKAL